MGNVFGDESPPSVYTTEYIKVKTLLIQMQTAGQGVIETLKLHRHTFDDILAENDRLTEALQKKKVLSRGSSEWDMHQRLRLHIEATKSAIDKGGVLQMKSMLHSIELLDYFINTAVRQHFSESVYQSLEETWKRTVQNSGTSTPVSRESNEDQVHCRIGPSGPSQNDSGSSVDGNDGPSIYNNRLELNIRKLTDELAEMRKQKNECVGDSSVKLESMKQVLEELQNQNNGLRNDVDSKKQEIDRLQSINEHNKAIEEKLQKLEKDFNGLQKENNELELRIQDIERENISLKERLNKKEQVNLQIWFEETELLTQVAIEFQEQVKSKCHPTLAVNCITTSTKADLKPNKPTMVLCINASRLGTDVARALDNIPWSPEVAVIVLHHKAKHALPNQSSDRVLTSPEYKQLGGIFDMAFLSGKGIYPCDMNDAALRMISEFLILASSRTS